MSPAPSRPSASPARSRSSRATPKMTKQPSPRSKAPADEEKGKTNADSTLSGLKGDWAAIGLLMLLYTLQGIPMGLFGSVPFLMQQKKVSMLDQSQFSLAVWPFSLKLMWAPLVDSVYSGRVGRRKTWIVPAQLAIGVLLLWSSLHIDTWLGEGIDSADVDVGTLTKLFLAFYFLAATQDIAVDGLALTILSPRNKELGATCNAIGQSVGANVAYTGFLALYTYGYVTLGGFMSFWGGVFLLSTVWVAVAKGDEHEPLRGSVGSILTSAYGEMLTVLKLPAVRSMALVLLTAKAALGVFDAVVPLRLVEVGVPKEHLAMIASSMFPVMLLAQLYVSGKYFAGKDSKPLLIWLGCYPYRILLGVVSALIVVVVAHLSAGGGGGLPAWLYAVMFAAMAVGTVLNGTMFVAQMAFYNRVSTRHWRNLHDDAQHDLQPGFRVADHRRAVRRRQDDGHAVRAQGMRRVGRARVAQGGHGRGRLRLRRRDRRRRLLCDVRDLARRGLPWFTAMRARVKSLKRSRRKPGSPRSDATPSAPPGRGGVTSSRGLDCEYCLTPHISWSPVVKRGVADAARGARAPRCVADAFWACSGCVLAAPVCYDPSK